MSISSVSVTREKCCGCGACEAICPKGAIEMQPNSGGFLYPGVDDGKCIGCGRCVSVCPMEAMMNYE